MTETNLTTQATTAPAVAPEAPERAVAIPAADLFATASGYRLLVDLPGVHQGDLQVQVEDGALILSANPSSPLPEGYDRLFGSSEPVRLQRRVQLNEDVDTEKISAVIKDGVLTVELPTAHVLTRQIEVLQDE